MNTTRKASETLLSIETGSLVDGKRWDKTVTLDKIILTVLIGVDSSTHCKMKKL